MSNVLVVQYLYWFKTFLFFGALVACLNGLISFSHIVNVHRIRPQDTSIVQFTLNPSQNALIISAH